MKQFIFLLGGYDLEMLEIKRILESRDDILVFDEHLRWDNADLSMYSTVLKKYGNNADVMIYGIELYEKNISSVPENYHRIDHHNDLNDKNSALEQVAEILRIKLSREQQLIAANDRGYIPAMKALGADPGEIEEIRKKDRNIQGVTEEDEQKAEMAIKNKVLEQDIVVVKSETNRFSPICDRLYPYDKLLVYTCNELMYYGIGKEKLAQQFENEIKEGKMFHGGGAEGYIGTARGAYSNNEILNMKNNIIQLINQ
ncbi:MAG: hypothetical protein LBU57_08920 [Dysgonamonadaceae bacterium]|jgi:hypothetical protein|nr:hypothetical protein [Dysgonamonadaceae bacterium]